MKPFVSLSPRAIFGAALWVALVQPGAAIAQEDQPPPPVDVATPLLRTMSDWDEYTGRFEAAERVELRPRVSGYIESVHFDDGQLVEKGDLLFVIDPRPYRAEVLQAEAALTRAKTQEALAQIELDRASQLFDSRNISEERVDQREANLEAAQADVAAAEAVLDVAKLNFSFTEVRAPIAGRSSNRRVDIGNLVAGGTAQSTLLTTIVTLDPIHFVFDASEADYLRYARLSRKGGRPSSRDAANQVFVRLMDETKWQREGQMNFVDNSLDPNSGTIRGRATFDNADLFLTPGVFGRLRLIGSTEYEAKMIPDEAVLSDQAQKIVMAVDDEGNVAAKPVVLGPIVDGLRVIKEGIEANDRIVVKGIQRARPGGVVTPEEVEIKTAAETAEDETGEDKAAEDETAGDGGSEG